MNRRSLRLVFSFAASAVLLLSCLTCCGGSSSSGNSATVSIVPPASTNVDPGDSVTLSASISHGSGEGVTWSLSGSGCSASTCGSLSNSSTSAVTYTAPSTVTSALTVTITASAVKDNVSATLNLTVPPNPSIAPASGALAAGAAGTPYNVALSVSGGISPYSWSVSQGTLPTGLTLASATGAVSGTPSSAGSYAFTVKVTDSGTPTALTATASLTIAITGGSAIVFGTTALPLATVNSPYSATIAASGGSGALSYALSGSGSLPAGLTLAASGAISGTPTAAGTSKFTVTASDTSGNSATASFSILVNSTSLAITSTNLPSGTAGTAYSFTFQASGGAGSYTWSLASGSGALPAGITLSSAGLLAGTPTVSGSFPFAVQVTDAANNTISAPYTLTIHASTTCSHDGSGNSILKGNYAFLLSGFDLHGSPYEEIGDFAADGAGTISNGNADANGLSFAGTQTEQQFTFSGTYSIGSTDNRGIATWTNTNTSKTGLPGSSTYCFAADAVTSGVANSGRIIEADGSGFALTGFFQIQNPADFTNAAIDAGYVLGLQGFDTGSPSPARTAAVGQIAFNGAGGITAGQIDTASYQSSTESTDYTAQIPVVASGSSYSIAATGRGTLTLAGSQSGQTQTINAVVYVVGTGNKLLLITSDASKGLLAGQALQQTQSTFQTSDLSGGAVYREVRTTSPSSPPLYDDVRVGRYGFNGSGQVGEIRDENAGGTITLGTTKSGTYTVSSSGYLTLTGTNSNAPNFYLYAPNAGFGLDASGGVGFYTMTAQNAPSGGFSASTLAGNTFSFGTIAPAAYSTSGSSNNYPQIEIGVADFAAGGTVTGTTDAVQAPGGPLDMGFDQSFSSTWALDTTSSPAGATTGRFLLSTGGTIDMVGYMVSPTQAFLIEVTPNQDGLTLEGDHQ